MENVNTQQGELSREALISFMDRYISAMAQRNPALLGDVTQTRHSENNVMLAFGDGVWSTADTAEAVMSFADPVTRSAMAWGTLSEAEDTSPFGVRVKLTSEGLLAESEIVIVRPRDMQVSGFTADSLSPRSDLAPEGTTGTDRAGMYKHGDLYFDTLELNDGTVHARLHPECVRRENGVLTAHNPSDDVPPTFRKSCTEQFESGHFGANDRVRDRRFLMVDEEAGVVLTTMFIDHGGSRAVLTHKDGSTIPSRYRRPHTLHAIELFAIRDDLITGIEALHIGVPYYMPSAWPTNEPVQ